MARIRHIAVFCKDAEKEASFYKALFDLQEVSRSEIGTVYLSDGEINLALIQHREGMGELGVNHFGFEVESLEAFRTKMKDLDLERPLEKPNIPGAYFENKMKDPEGNTVDVSQEGEGWAR